MINKKLIKLIVITSIYIVLCVIFSFMSFGPIQLRISEILCLLTIENPLYIVAIALGCLISNLILSPLGTIDALIGTLASLIGCGLGYFFKNIKYKDFPILSAIIISLSNALLVSIEMSFILNNGTIFIYSFLEILVSELFILIVIGFPIYKKLLKIERGK